MGFQTVVNNLPAIGTPGLEVNPGQAIYTPFQYISDGTVEAGTFAFAVTNSGDGEKFNMASIKGSAGNKVIGFVERNLIGSLGPGVEGSNLYVKGQGLPIAIRGQFYMLATGAATEGQSVLCDPTTGAVTYGTAGATNDTGWVVRLPQGVTTVAKGDLIIVENFGLSITPPASDAGGEG